MALALAQGFNSQGQTDRLRLLSLNMRLCYPRTRPRVALEVDLVIGYGSQTGGSAQALGTSYLEYTCNRRTAN